MTTPARAALDWVLDEQPPTEADIKEGFSAAFLAQVPAENLQGVLVRLVAPLREDLPGLSLLSSQDHALVAVVAQTEIHLTVEPEAPHRISGLLFKPATPQVNDTRLTDPPNSADGPIRAAVSAVATSAWQDGSLVGLAVAVQDAGQLSTATVGWADLDADRAVAADDVFPAYSVTKLFTCVVALQLVAEGALALDEPIAAHLTSLELEHPEATLRQVLTHCSGVSSDLEHWADVVPDQVSLLGPRVRFATAPGQGYVYSNGAFAVLGQLIADVTGAPYVDAVTSRVLQPLGLSRSGFPTSVPSNAVALHQVSDDATIKPAARHICSMPSAGGLWSTLADLSRFATGWSSLLPEELAAEALRPQQPRGDSRGSIGLAFLLSEGTNGQRVAGHGGGGIGAASSVLLLPDEGVAAVALTNLSAPVEPVAVAALRSALDQRDG